MLTRLIFVCCRGKRVSKVKTLQRAIDYIYILQDLLHSSTDSASNQVSKNNSSICLHQLFASYICLFFLLISKVWFCVVRITPRTRVCCTTRWRATARPCPRATFRRRRAAGATATTAPTAETIRRPSAPPRKCWSKITSTEYFTTEMDLARYSHFVFIWPANDFFVQWIFYTQHSYSSCSLVEMLKILSTSHLTIALTLSACILYLLLALSVPPLFLFICRFCVALSALIVINFCDKPLSTIMILCNSEGLPGINLSILSTQCLYNL